MIQKLRDWIKVRKLDRAIKGAVKRKDRDQMVLLRQNDELKDQIVGLREHIVLLEKKNADLIESHGTDEERLQAEIERLETALTCRKLEIDLLAEIHAADIARRRAEAAIHIQQAEGAGEVDLAELVR